MSTDVMIDDVTKVLTVIGLEDKGIEAVKRTKCRIKTLPDFKGAPLSNIDRTNLWNQGATARDIEKVIIFMDYFTNTCNPNKRKFFLDFFTEDVWEEHLRERKYSRYQRSQNIGWLICTVCFTICLVLAIVLPQVLVGNRMLLYKHAELEAICATNLATNIRIPVNCEKITCTCCWDETSLFPCQ